MIKKNVSINRPSELFLKEGILANDDILSFDEFRSFILPFFDNDLFINNLENIIKDILYYINFGNYQKAYYLWETKFESEILNNQNYRVSLFAIQTIDSDSGNYQYSYATQEHELLTKSGAIKNNADKMKDNLFKLSMQDQISSHLYEFINDVKIKKMDYKFIKQIFNLDDDTNDDDVKRAASLARWYNKDWTYKNILFGNSKMWRGHVADAFVNHMAHLHVQTIAGAVSADKKELFANSVFNEERDNIFKLLYDSKNKIPWYSGGDVIIKYGGQIYNIQVKTVLENTKKNTFSKLSFKQFTLFLRDIQNNLKTNREYVIKKMYNELKTSGWVENINQTIGNIAENMVDF